MVNHNYECPQHRYTTHNVTGVWVGGKLFIHVYFSSTFNQQRGTQTCGCFYMGFEVDGGTRLASDVRGDVIGQEEQGESNCVD